MGPSEEATFRVSRAAAAWGDEAERVLAGIERRLKTTSSDPEVDYRRIRDDAYRVFSRCTLVPARVSQLVVGRVQAGKTTNFTATSALARDNGYRLTIVLAGTKTELLSQTYRRLKKDLAGIRRSTLPAFSVHELRLGHIEDLARKVTLQINALSRRPDGHAAAPVVVVLKEVHNLEGLIELLKSLQTHTGLADIPTLVIDDEADQASPDNNTRRPGDVTSRIHGLLGDVRKLLPWHTYLAYTATPQANVLMEIDGLLHPGGVTVIDAGVDYVGVSDLFGPQDTEYATEILDTPPAAGRTPDSLRLALATFLCQLVLAHNYADQIMEPADEEVDDDTPSALPISMLVNPGSPRADHDEWTRLINSELDAWREQLEDLADLATVRLRDQFLAVAWKSLRDSIQRRHSGASLPPSPEDEDLDAIRDLIPRLAVRKANSSATGDDLPRDDEWDDEAGWIFVGGEVLGRGQTLRNLMTTYMPRSPGMRAVDTLQQRGRFYGYHAQYRALLRGWFEPDTLEAYQEAGQSEERLFASLSRLDRANEPLASWTRAILLGPGRLRATRQSVIPRVVREFKLNEWALSQAYLLDDQVNTTNLETVNTTLSDLRDRLIELPGRGDPGRRNYEVRMTRLEALELLSRWAAAAAESQQLADLTLLLSSLEDEDLPEVQLIAVNRPVENPLDTSAGGYRSLAGSASAGTGGQLSSDRIGNPLSQQDRALHDRVAATIQLHVFRVGNTAREQPSTAYLTQQAPAMVVHLPQALRQRIVAQAPQQ